MSEMMTGPICPCGHPVAGHFLAGCLDTQRWDETSDDFCPCDRDEDQADEAAISTRLVDEEVGGNASPQLAPFQNLQVS